VGSSQLYTHDFGNTDLWQQVNLRDAPVEVQAYVLDSSIDAEGDLSLKAFSDQSIDALVLSGSAAIGAGPVGVGVAAAGSAAVNKITTQVQAFIDGDGVDGIRASSVRLHAADASQISAITGAAAVSGGFGAVGVSVSVAGCLAHNEIGNDIAAYITRADSLHTTGVGPDDGIVIEASEAATIKSLTTAASLSAGIGAVGVAVSGAGAVATNIILTTTHAYVADSVLVSANDVLIEASDTSTIQAIVATASGAVGGGAVGVGVSIGAALARNFIGWDLIPGWCDRSAGRSAGYARPPSPRQAIWCARDYRGGDQAIVLASSAAIGAGGWA
jgi:hypothetical protein